MKHKTCSSCGTVLQRDEIYTGVCMQCRLEKDEKAKKTAANPGARPEAPKETPRPAAAAPAQTGSAPEAKPAAKPAGTETILVIDDDPYILKVLESRLQASGYRVLTCEDGEAGYKMIKDKRPDLVVSDILMPRMTGYDLIQKLKKETDGTQLIPVLILTAKESMKSFFSGWEIHGFMVKPVKSEELLEKIESLLRTARIRREKGLT